LQRALETSEDCRDKLLHSGFLILDWVRRTVTRETSVTYITVSDRKVHYVSTDRADEMMSNPSPFNV
jgi:hypothetical protein